MFLIVKCIYVILILLVTICSASSILGFVEENKPNEPLLRLPNMKNTNLRSEGIFVRFLRHLLETLSTFPEKRLPRLFRVLSRHVSELEYKHAKELARYLKSLSRRHREDIKDEIMMCKQELVKKRQHRIDFLEAMNGIFTLREHILFDDFIYELKNYGTEDKLFLDEETKKIINEVIMKSIMRMSSKDRHELQKKLKYAVKEFKHERNLKRYLRNN